jgi:hypothetical protein
MWVPLSSHRARRLRKRLFLASRLIVSLAAMAVVGGFMISVGVDRSSGPTGG